MICPKFRHIFLIICGLSLIAGLAKPASVFAATPTVTSLSPLSTSVGQYQKFEASFNISQIFAAGSLLPYYYYDPADNPTAYPNKLTPYGVDGISIDAHITAPSGRQLTVPAFYYQDYTRSGSITSGEVMTTTNTYSWKLRFAPEETGTYNYFLTIVDKNGSTRYPAAGGLTFTSLASASKGFIRASTKDPRFLDYSTGNSFIPVGSGHQWWLCCGMRSFDYDKAFTDFANNGINLTRIWDQNDGYSLTVENHFDAYSYPDDYNPDGRIDLTTIPKGTQINQRGAAEEDAIIQSAEKNNVYIQLTSHGDPYWTWDASVYNETWNPSPVAFSDPLHINYWKRNFRYRVARWGYSTAILAWETWNEHGHVLPGTDIYNFYQTYSQYQSATDPYRHLRTTSQGSQAYSPAFWSSAAFDMANYHNYMMGWLSDDLKYDEANFVYKTAWCLQPSGQVTTVCQYLGLGDGTSWSGPPKPWIWGEIDVGTLNWNEVNPLTQTGEGRLRELHNSMWAGLFSPLGTSPLDWFWNTEDTATTLAKYAQKKAVNLYFKDIDYSGSHFTYLMSASDAPNGYTGETVPITDTGARAYVMRRGDRNGAYVWVQNKLHTWNNATTTIPAVSPTVTVPGLANQTYSVQTWNAYTGSLISSASQTVTAGTLNLSVVNLMDDVAFKILPTSNVVNPSPTLQPTVAPTSGPTATPAVTTPVPGNGDVNNDGVVNMSDVTALLNSWNTVSTLTDQYPDKQINSLDFLVIKNSFPVPTSTPAATPTSVPLPTVTSTPAPVLLPTPVPTSIPTPAPTGTVTSSAVEWTQFGHDSQHTNYTAQTVAAPWQFAWVWNGADATGHTQTNHLQVPDLVQPVTGGGRVYLVANNQVFGIDQSTGSTSSGLGWSTSANLGTLAATPAYDGTYVYVTSGNGSIYKLNASTGQIVSSFTAAAGCNLAPALVKTTLYAACSNGVLYAVNTATMQQLWSYQGGGPSVSPPAYSAKYQTIVYNTQDLVVHAVNAGTGALIWRTNPWNLTNPPRHYEPGDYIDAQGAQFDRGWPVIAEQHGIVLVKLNLDADTLYGTEANGAYPSGTAAAQNYIKSNPALQTVFALKITDGSTAFVPGIGAGTHTDSGARMGPQPVVAIMNGQEVVYDYWRTKDSCSYTPVSPDFTGTLSWCGGMWDAALGEMVLDDTTVPGYVAGQLRYVNFQIAANQTGPSFPSDELAVLSMSGNTIFHSHWLTSFGKTITDRSSSLGNSFTNPIKTTQNQPTVWAEGSPNTYNVSCNFSTGHYCSSGLVSYGGGNTDFVRSYPPGFYQYYNDWCTLTNTCGNLNNSNSDPFTVVSNNLIVIKGSDGSVIALKNGNPLAQISAPLRVLGASVVSPQKVVPASQVHQYLTQTITVQGTVTKTIDHLPKAYYLTLKDATGQIQARVFVQDIKKFPYSLSSLLGKEVQITGLVSLYGPQGFTTEIQVSQPNQIVLVNNSLFGRIKLFFSRLF